MRFLPLCFVAFLFVLPAVQGQASFQKVVFKHAVKKTVRKLKHAESVVVYTREADYSEKMFKGKLQDITPASVTLNMGALQKTIVLSEVSRIEAHHKRSNWSKWLLFGGLLLLCFGVLYSAIAVTTAAAFYWAGGAAAGGGGGCALIAIGAIAFFVGLFGGGSSHVVIDNPATEWVIEVIRQA